MISENSTLDSVKEYYDKSVHYGLFDCGPAPVANAAPAAAPGACC